MNDKPWIRYRRLKKLFSDGFVYATISYTIAITISSITKNVLKNLVELTIGVERKP